MFLCIRVGFLGFVAGATGEFSICSSKFCWVGNLAIFLNGGLKMWKFFVFSKGGWGEFWLFYTGCYFFARVENLCTFAKGNELSVYSQGGGSRYSCSWRKNSRNYCNGRKNSRDFCKGRAEFSVFAQNGKFSVFCQRGRLGIVFARGACSIALLKWSKKMEWWNSLSFEKRGIRDIVAEGCGSLACGECRYPRCLACPGTVFVPWTSPSEYTLTA